MRFSFLMLKLSLGTHRSERHAKVLERMKQLQAGDESFGVKIGEALTIWLQGRHVELASVLHTQGTPSRLNLFLLCSFPLVGGSLGQMAAVGVMPERAVWPAPTMAHVDEAAEHILRFVF